MENLRLRLIGVKSHLPDVKTFRFALEKEIPRRPGQYLILTLNLNGKDTPKAFSISSSPTEKGYIEFTKKLTGSEFSDALNGLKTGELFSVRMPMGKFTFEGEFPGAAFLSGGIGITPIRSIFKYATDMRLSSSLILAYSSRTPEYLIFRSDFEEMQRENKNIKLVYTLTDYKDKVPGCRSGRIDENLIREEIPDYKDRRFFMCGPPQMVDAMKTMLLDKLALPPANVITEDFVGY